MWSFSREKALSFFFCVGMVGIVRKLASKLGVNAWCSNSFIQLFVHAPSTLPFRNKSKSKLTIALVYRVQEMQIFRRMTQGWCRDQHDLISLRYGSVLAWQTGHRNSQIVLSTFDFRSTTTTCYGTHDHSPPSLQDLRSRQLVRWHPATQAAHPMTYEGPQKVSCQLPAMPCATEGASANATMLCSQASVLNLRPGTRDVQCDNNTGL
jgi:hypothetical protein